MSFVTFVRDYIQDPDRIVHVPNFIFDACKEFFWYIFSFQWFRNLTYVTLSFPNSEKLAGERDSILNIFSTFDIGLTKLTSIPSKSLYGQSTNRIENLLHDGSWLSTSFELPPEQISLFQNSLYGFFNGLSSTFHFCAVTILIIHVLLNEDKNRAFKVALASCLGDVSCMVAVLLGFTGLVVPWLSLEPLGYILGFAIQFFFALEIIKDNRRIKANTGRQFDRRWNTASQDQEANIGLNLSERGQLSFNRWLIPSLVIFSWCEQTQFFQSAGVFSLQPTATLLEIPGFIYHTRELQIIIYLFTFIATRILVTWFCLSVFQNLVNWKDNTNSSVSSLFNFWVGLPLKSKSLLTSSGRQKTITYIKNSLLKIGSYVIQSKSLFSHVKSWFIPKSLQKEKQVSFTSGLVASHATNQAPSSVGLQRGEMYILSNQRGKKIQHFLRDPLAIAAVTCSLAFLPSYSTNLLVTKSIGFFPEENRIKHSLFSPWDMPATVLASDMDFISNHPNLAEYPFFLPFYDKGEYGGWLGVGEEDIRYGPFRLWQSRRIRAPWRRTTLQEPALTFANDKSLFINPLLRTPNLKNSFVLSSDTKEVLSEATSKQSKKKDSKDLSQETANIKTGAVVGPVINFASEQTPENTFLFQDEPSLISSSTQTNSSLPASYDQGAYYLHAIRSKHVPSSNKIQKQNKAAKKNERNLGFSVNGLDYLWKQFKTQSAYTKLLAINHIKPSKTEFVPFTSYPIVSLIPKVRNREVTALQKSNIQTQNTIKAENSKITKSGRKKIIEVLKKPLRKVKTSKLHFDGSIHENLSGSKNKQNNLLKNLFDNAINRRPLMLHSKKVSGTIFDGKYVPSLMGTPPSNYSTISKQSINQEAQIKDNKQIRKRFKKFKKKLRLFRTRAYKKRNTKIKRLKHFHYIRNKNKKRRKSRRLIYKLRRQYPYIRNIKERKANLFGLYSPTQGLKQSLENKDIIKNGKHNQSLQELGYMPDQKNELSGYAPELQNNNKIITNQLASYNTGHSYALPKFEQQSSVSNKINFQDKPFYSTEYPKKKGFINVKRDFNLIFRTQIGERLDFAQEEIRARIFMNPYVRFLLNNRIDNFISRSNEMSSSIDWLKKTHQVPTTTSVTPKVLQEDGKKMVVPSTPTIQNKDLKENDLFKRRLIISKYADAVDFLKPSLRHSYADRVYNHQFKGTLSTARRLFSLKVQYDRPLVHALNYKSAMEHEGLLSLGNTAVPSEMVTIKDGTPVSLDVVTPKVLQEGKKQESKHDGDDQKPKSKPLFSNTSKMQGNSTALFSLDKKAKKYDSETQKQAVAGQSKQDKYTHVKNYNEIVSNKINEQNLELQPKIPNLLEKGRLAPLYAAWDPQLRKLVLTNRYLDYKTITTFASQNSEAQERDSETKQQDNAALTSYVIRNTSKAVPKQVTSNKEQILSKATNKKIEKTNNSLIQFTNWPLKESYFKDNEFLVSQLYSNSQPIDSFLSQENEKARPVALPRRVNSFNTVLNYKNNVQPTDAQRSQQFLKLESNDKKTFLFKHFWNSSNTAGGLIPTLSSKLAEPDKPLLKDRNDSKTKHSFAAEVRVKPSAFQVPTSAEQRKANRTEEREHPLWMVLKALPPNQGGFLWPGD